MMSLLRALSESYKPTPAAVECAAAPLPPARFRPDLTPTATKLYAALLRADQPVGRSELIDRADIPRSSYDRRVGAVTPLDRGRAVQVDGHRRWATTDSRPSIGSSAAVTIAHHDRGSRQRTTIPLLQSRQQLPDVGEPSATNEAGRLGSHVGGLHHRVIELSYPATVPRPRLRGQSVDSQRSTRPNADHGPLSESRSLSNSYTRPTRTTAQPQTVASTPHPTLPRKQ